MKVEVESFGCRLNHAEAEQIAHRLRHSPLLQQDEEREIIVVNSCAVTNEAERQVRQRLRRLRRTRPQAQIFVTGCASETDWDAYARMPAVDGVVENDRKTDPSAYVTTLPHARSRSRSASPALSTPVVPDRAMRTRFFMPVQQGCDYHCTFCIIPYARGKSRSLDAAACCEVAQRAVDEGVREIVLTGVDLASWGGGALGDLVGAILHAVPSLPRLRLSSLDGAAVDDRLRALIATEPRLMPQIHLSLQSGDDMILKRMLRRHRRAEALSLCRELRRLRSDIALGADFIAGFPTETEAMFENTCRFIDAAEIDFLHIFPFSPRRHTAAARMPQVPREIVRARAQRLRIKAMEAQKQFLAKKAGQKDSFLVEQPKDAVLVGRCRHNVRTILHCPEGVALPRQGDVVDARITRGGSALLQEAVVLARSGVGKQEGLLCSG